MLSIAIFQTLTRLLCSGIFNLKEVHSGVPLLHKGEEYEKKRLYIIEGLPCSGKSTTSGYVCELLKERGELVCFVDEGSGNHPADYEFHSFISAEEFEKLSLEEQGVILESSEQRCGGYIVPISVLSGKLFDKVLQFKIYDFLDWETERRLMLDKWQSFADGCNRIYVFNCCLIQNPMCETMMRFNFDIEMSRKYISDICSIIGKLSPVVIYLRNTDIEASVRRTIPERGEEWLNEVVDYHVNGGYGKSEKLSGFEGYIACLTERQRRELEILKTLPVESLVIENAHKNWDEAHKRIRDYIIG